jgi:hypothetical protein
VFWLNPSALFALVAAAAPILIHLLIRRRAERFAFPTLRFLQPTRLAAIRRHVLEDLPLLAVRVALLAAAVAALAGPLFVTAALRQAWDRRIVRATITDLVGAELAPPVVSRAEQARPRRDAPYREQMFEATSLADGIRRAVLWLDAAPPARREILIASPFPVGSLAQADVALIPPDIGVRFERTGTLPVTRTAPAGAVLTPAGARARDVTFTRGGTSVHEAPSGDPVAFPVEVVGSAADRPPIDAAVAAVLSQRVWAAASDRHARLILANGAQPPSQGFGEPRRSSVEPNPSGGGSAVRLSDATAIHEPWMADAVARVARDPDLRAAGARVTAGLSEARFAAAPWQSLASAGDGRPLAAAAASAQGLVIVTAAPASDIATPVLVRSIANALGPSLDFQRAEVVPIGDAVLHGWSRPPVPVTSPRMDSVDEDDRRWLWLAALFLLAVEMWMRARATEIGRDSHEEEARVA